MASRKDSSRRLGKIISIQDILINTVSKIMGKSQEEVEEALKQSSCYAKLNEAKSDYYLSDMTLIVADFKRECEEKYSWIQT